MLSAEYPCGGLRWISTKNRRNPSALAVGRFRALDRFRFYPIPKQKDIFAQTFSCTCCANSEKHKEKTAKRRWYNNSIELQKKETIMAESSVLWHVYRRGRMAVLVHYLKSDPKEAYESLFLTVRAKLEPSKKARFTDVWNSGDVDATAAMILPYFWSVIGTILRTDDKVSGIIDRLSGIRATLVVGNSRLAYHIAGKHAKFLGHSSFEYDDLCQEGIVGLIHAIDGFDPSMGHKFSSYAVKSIKRAISRGLSQRGRHIRVPAHLLENKRPDDDTDYEATYKTVSLDDLFVPADADEQDGLEMMSADVSELLDKANLSRKEKAAVLYKHGFDLSGDLLSWLPKNHSTCKKACFSALDKIRRTINMPSSYTKDDGYPGGFFGMLECSAS